MFDPKHPRGVYPGASAIKPMHVLITEDGDERTSNVTIARIYRAVYEIKANRFVTLEKCRPEQSVVTGSPAFAMAYYDDSRMAVFFKAEGTVMRMSRSGYACDEAVEMMCDFFERSAVPDMRGWACDELKPAPRKAKSTLMVDQEEFRFFDFSDVIAAFENIIEGKSKSMLHTHNGDGGGYFHIRRSDYADGRPACKAEWVRWGQPEATGCRAVITDFDSLRDCLWKFSMERIYPEVAAPWERFDVTDYFEKLLFSFLDNDERKIQSSGGEGNRSDLDQLR